MQSSTAGIDEGKQLNKLLGLIKVSPSKQQLPSLDFEAVGSRIQERPNSQGTEARYLEHFSLEYKDVRNFQGLKYQSKYTEIFAALVKYRLNNDDWSERAPPENILRVVTVLRLLLRDPVYQKHFLFKLKGLPRLSQCLERFSIIYLTQGDSPFIVRILIEMTNIIQKLSYDGSTINRELIVDNGALKSLVMLLTAKDVTLIHCTMFALIYLSESEKARRLISDMNCLETIVTILREYDLDSRRNAAKLLKNMCGDAQTREWIKILDYIPLLLRLLNEQDLKLLRYVVWCLVQLAEDADTSNDLRHKGVIPLLINLIQEEGNSYSNELASAAPASATLGGRQHPLSDEESTPTPLASLSLGHASDEMIEQVYQMKAVCCAALTELLRNDHNSQQIVSNNGVYVIASLILPERSPKTKASDLLQKNALRTLRFLFSMERNRRMFKRIFHTSQAVFTAFIGVGHYVHTIESYQQVVDKLNSLSENERAELRENIDSTNQQREVEQRIEDYDVLELLGSGAFGSVYKVRKKDTKDSFYALKEVNLNQVSSGKDKERSKGEIISEINMIREELKHPNIVKYYRTLLVEKTKLCIVMELIDGAPIGEHFTSLREKNDKFGEPRIWNIYIQIVLALRYLHKEKHIVHRDLSPNNIMLGENDRVTITDFGLAKHKQSRELISCVGTIQYSCPEIVQSQPYGEKADIWAIGCILYQMCTLHPPFEGNLLALSTKIVAGRYKAVDDRLYSTKMAETIASCLTVEPSRRPDILGVTGIIAEQFILYTESLRKTNSDLERKLEKERKRTQNNSRKAKNYMQNYQKLFIASQERYDRLANSQNSQSSMGYSIRGAHFTDMNNNERGGVSGDDEEEPSSSDSCGSSSSLRQGFSRPPIHPSANCRKLDFDQLNVEIPANRGARDSGFSSAGEPSPGNEVFRAPHHVASFQRSMSSPIMEQGIPMRQRSGGKARPSSNSTAATLSISPRKVRQISDPLQKMFMVLHKVIYVAQLPPTLKHNPRRSIIEKFKRSLFTTSTNAAHLKTELKKLAAGSKDTIDLHLGSVELHEAVVVDQNGSHKHSPSRVDHDNGLENDFSAGLTYEHMLTIIEMVLHETKYYSIEHRANPQTPSKYVRQQLL